MVKEKKLRKQRKRRVEPEKSKAGSREKNFLGERGKFSDNNKEERRGAKEA